LKLLGRCFEGIKAEVDDITALGLWVHGPVICPTSDFRERMSSPPAKNILLPFFGNM
jgi:hypothetical protein